MMNDRELLELAAKAIGLDVCREAVHTDEYLLIGTGRGDLWRWEPMIDDGQALRLAVKIGLEECLPYIEGALDAARIDGKCELSSVRRAIVRAAAEIGRRIQ